MTTSTLSRLGEAPEEGIKAPVKTISSGNIALFDIGQTLGGYVVQDNDRIAVNGQTDTTENGIYVARQGRDWVRASDFNANEDVVNGQLVVDANTSAVYIISAPDPWVPGTDSVAFGLLLSPVGFFWGSIGGTLSNQGDLQAALDAKADLVHTHVEADITDLQPYLLDAPTGGQEFARQGGAWVNLDLANRFAALSHTHVEADITDLQAYLIDAAGSIAADGELYARRDGAWEAFSTAAGTVGEIIIWPDTDPPENFLLCDGQSYNTSVFSDLFAVLGYKYGGSGPNFNVPDLRGEFVRGTANGSGADPDRNSRTDRGDGVTGDQVGTKQGDQFASHQHNTTIGKTASSTGAGGASGQPAAGVNTTSTGGSETRPRNVGMNFMIRFTGGGSGITQPPSIEIQDNGVPLTTAVELLNFLNFNLTEPLDDQINIAFGASPNAAAFCFNYGFTFVNTLTFELPSVDATNLVAPGKRLRFVDGALNYFGIVVTSVFSGGDTVVTMSMEGGDVLTNSITEVCAVNGAGGWTPIAGDPFSGNEIRDIYSGFIGGTKYWQICGDNGRLAYSTDAGLTWTVATSGTTENLNQISYNPDSETFLIAGDNGVLLRSTDGETWSVDTTSVPGLPGSSGARHVRGVGYDYNNVDNWVILYLYDGISWGTAYSTDDGLTWQNGDAPAFGGPANGNGLLHEIFNGGGGAFNGWVWGVGEDSYTVSSASDTTASIFANTSGQPQHQALASLYANGALQTMIVKGNQLNESTSVRDDATFGSSNMLDITWIPTLERLIVVGEDSKIGQQSLADTENDYFDYLQLEANGGNPLADYLCVHWDEDDGIIAACNNQGQVVRSVNGLGDPITPVEFTGFTLIGPDPFSGQPINRICSGTIGGTHYWVAIGGGGLLFTSTDAGLTWTQRTTGTTANLISIDYNSTDQQFFVGAANGDFLTSTNGTTWTLDNTTIAALGGAGSLAILGVLWDAMAGLWWIALDYSGSTTRRTYTTDVNVTTFTARDSSVSIQQQTWRAHITPGQNQIIFPDNNDEAGFFIGAADTTDSSFTSTSGGGNVSCIFCSAGTGGFAFDVLIGHTNGGVKRFGSTGFSAGTVRGLQDSDQEALTNIRINSIAYSTVSARWILVCDNSEIYSLPGSSFDVARNAFQIVNNPFTGNINDIWYSAVDDLFIAVGNNGEIGRSTDGIS